MTGFTIRTDEMKAAGVATSAMENGRQHGHRRSATRGAAMLDILTARHEAAHAVIAAVLDCTGDGFPSSVVLHRDGGGMATSPIMSGSRGMDVTVAGLVQETIDCARNYFDIMAGARNDLAMLALGDEYTEAVRDEVARMTEAPKSMLAVALPRLAERRDRVEAMLRRHQQYVYSVANWLVVERELDQDQLRYVLGPIAGAELPSPPRSWRSRARARWGAHHPTVAFAQTSTDRDSLR